MIESKQASKYDIKDIVGTATFLNNNQQKYYIYVIEDVAVACGERGKIKYGMVSGS